VIGATIPVHTPPVDWLAVAPVLSLVIAALLVIMLRGIFRHTGNIYTAALGIATVGIVVCACFLARQWSVVTHHGHGHGPYVALANMVAIDGFSVFVGYVILIAAALTLLLSSQYLERRGIESRPEYVVLVLLAAAGMLVMTTANDLIVVFIALETLSIPLYVLAAYDRTRRRSLEAGMKYFVLGAFSSAIFLYGVALVYGATGTTSLLGIADFLAKTSLFESGTLVAGIVLLLVGLGFKIAAVPFHMWTPDVYEGSPTPVTGFMSSATKAAGFAALLRVLFSAFEIYRADWQPVIWALAILTLVVGSAAAIVQSDIKRMLAYSSISHAGFVLIGVETGTHQGLKAALFYLLVYAFMTIGSFAIVTVVGRRDDRHRISDYRGFGSKQPVIAALLALFLLAQAGIPPTAGFIAKLGVFAAAASADTWQGYSLLIVGVLASVIAAYFYLRVIIVMYGSEAEEPEGEEAARAGAVRLRINASTGAVLVVCAVATLWMGILPTVFMNFAGHATLAF
jgi:NADH-quinone oxidoreductase subunit N